MPKSLLLAILFSFSFSFFSIAQNGEIINKKEQKRLLEEGEYYYDVENYLKALEYFQKLEEVNPNDSYYKLVIGICYSYKVDEKQKSIEYLEKVKEMDPDFNEVNLYLGRAYAVNQRFDEAIAQLELYLQDESLDDEYAKAAQRLIETCQNGKTLTSDSLELVVQNMGKVLNTEANEYVPLITPDESQLIFTYRGPKSLGDPDAKGKYFEDIYISYKSPDDWLYEEDVWMEPEGIESLNTENDDACIAITIDGQKLFLYKYDKNDGGDIYISQLDGSVWSEPMQLDGGINSKYWEGSVAISSDEKELYFASDRPGGFGGRDLYRAEKLDDGTWGNVQNLGPEINTPYNDDSPFIQIDKQTLFFSSEGHNSMGGHDVFFSKRDLYGNWGAANNIGYPINTVEDDRYFVVSPSGRKGFYSSAGINSIGGQDLYYVDLDPEKMGIKSIAALVIGTVYADDVPTEALVTITNETNQTTAGVFRANSETGKYGIALAPGFEYSITYDVDSFEMHRDEIDLTELEDYIEVSNNVYVYSDKYVADNNIVRDTSLLSSKVDSIISNVPLAQVEKPDPDRVIVDDPGGGVNPIVKDPVASKDPDKTATKDDPDKMIADSNPPMSADTAQTIADNMDRGDQPCDDEYVDLSSFVGKDLNTPAVYMDLVSVVGNYCADDLVFKVQIGAYRFPQNFKYTHLDRFGTAKVIDYPDGITRFTMGEFVTLKDADDLRQKIIKAGQEDAWVIPFFEGKRIFMEELIKVNFYNRSIN